MAIQLDETYEEQQSRENIEKFYGTYSADVRKKLLAKNVPRPENLYDILYSKPRRDLLAKNVPSKINIDTNSSEIRDGLLARQVEKDIDLDRSGENIRKALLSKNELIKSTLDMENVASASRNNLLSKNVSNESANPTDASKNARNRLLTKNVASDVDLDEMAEKSRDSLLSKNVSNQKNIDEASSTNREHLLSKNQTNGNNIDASSEIIRNGLLSKNVSSENDLDKSSVKARENLLSKNNDGNQNDIDAVADNARMNLLSSNVKKPSTLEENSQEFRSRLDSKNKPSQSSIDEIAESSREKLISKNVDSGPMTDAESKSVRDGMLSKNVLNGDDIDRSSKPARENLLSKNVESKNDLDETSSKIRESLKAANKPSGASPENGASEVKEILLSANKPNNVDLDKLGQDSRNNLLSNNVPNGASPENGAEDARDSILSKNVPNGASPENGAEDVRDSILSKNVSNGANPENGAGDARDGLISKNVSNGASPENGASDTRDSLLSKNVPNGASPENGDDEARITLLSKNEPTHITVETGANEARNLLLSKNVPNGASPENGDDEARISLLSKNEPTHITVETGTNDIRNNLLASNTPNGANVAGLGVQPRNDLLSKNVPGTNNIDGTANPFRHYLLSKNENSTPLGTNLILPNGTSQFIGISNLTILGELNRLGIKLREKIFKDNTAENLQKNYGTQVEGSTGGVGIITLAAQFANTEINTYALNYQKGSKAGFTVLSQHNTDGFQKLLTMSGVVRKPVQDATNTTPAEVIEANNGQYLPLGDRGIDAILKPVDGIIGGGLSMASQSEPSDAIARNFYRTTNFRGVVDIMNNIRNSDFTIAKNYDSQNQKAFTISSSPTAKKAYQRYTIANPYAAPNQKAAMDLRITNFSIPDTDIKTMSFPPYVESFQHSDNASWTETLFLGRPEPVYTYSNSSRGGSISFKILTDYAQSVDIGVDFQKGETMTQDFSKHFTSSAKQNIAAELLAAEIAKKNKVLAELSLKRSQLENDEDVGGIANIDKEIVAQKTSISSTQSRLDKVNKEIGNGPDRVYSDTTTEGNIYKTVIQGKTETDAVGNITSTPADTIEKLNNMKEKLFFQPAFFSGDKVDFLRRMEFIAKLTRPSRNTGSSDGFSFIRPPVCHLKLGDWINHTVIIDSVSYDYADTTWTFDGDRVQPMWATITLNYKIIGTYGSSNVVNGQDVPLSTDNGGFFQERIST